MNISGIPGAFYSSPVAPLSINGTPVDVMSAAIVANSRLLGSQRQINEERFWSSAARDPSDTTREIYSLTLNTHQEINFISLELARFPQRVWVQWYDDASSTWKPVQDTTTTTPVLFTLTDSIPSQFLATSESQSKTHPQHYGAGHWVLFKQTFRTVSAAKLRLVMVRIPGIVPVDRSGHSAPYSLGVRNAFFGFDATDINLIPRTPFVSETEHLSFAGVVDGLRSNISYSLRENSAHSVLATGVWRSAPQPVRGAVVTLHVDARDADGQPQVIDRFFVDPLYSGPKMNLYYTDKHLPLPGGSASDRPLTTAVHAALGVDPAESGILLSDALGTIDIDMSSLRVDLSSPWWMGIQLHPQFDSTETNDRVILSAGAMRGSARIEEVVDFRWSAVDMAWRLTYNGITAVLYETFSVNQTLSYVISFDGSTMTVQSKTYSGSEFAQPWDGSLIPSLRFGQDSGGMLTGTGKFRLDDFVVKNEVLSSTSTTAFFSDPYSYVTNAPYPYLDDDSTKGAILRYSDAYKVLGSNYLGFVGEALFDYESMVWTPINRDYELRRGLLLFNPVKAAAFKFEFYDLSPQNYDSQAVVTRTVRLFPTDISTPKIPFSVVPLEQVSSAGSGVKINTTKGPVSAGFSDSATVNIQRNGVAVPLYSPTEVTYAEDPVMAEGLRRTARNFDYMRWLESPQRFRFPKTQVHNYRFIDVKHDHRVAFFVGIKDLQMFRVDYIREDDTDQYLEVFHDSRHIQDAVGYSAPQFIPGAGLRSDQGLSLVVEAKSSNSFASKRKVRAIQFATTQSDPFQMLYNSDFDDIAPFGWEAVGDAVVTPSSLFNSTLGTTAEVRRSRTSNTWDLIEVLYAVDPNPNSTWNDMDGLSWDALESSGSPMGSGGVVSTDYKSPSTIGRLYAAARAYAPKTLTQPLYLQIISEDGSIVAEATRDVAGNSIAEWYVGYTIGEGGATNGNTWDQAQTLYMDTGLGETNETWDEIEAAGALWRDLEASTMALAGRFTARLVQKDATDDIFYVDNISLFDDPIVWDFSSDGGTTWWPVYDIKNNPHGVFVFPSAGRELQWRVRFGRSDAWVSAIDVRPQYSELPLGIAYREGIERGNGNIGHWDHYNPITVDPRFKMWDKPIPESWWFVNRQWLITQTPSGTFTPLVPPVITVDPSYLEEVLVVPKTTLIVLGEVLPT